MAAKGLRWIVPMVPGLMQIPVCLALIFAGFNFENWTSTVMFLYAYHYIMMALKAFFRFFFQQDCEEDVCLPIKIFNAVTQLILQCWGLIAVSAFVWKNDNNSCEKPPTVISAIIIVGIELGLVVITFVNISKCLWEKRPQKSTNSRTPEDNNEPNEDKDGLLTSNNSDTENDTHSF